MESDPILVKDSVTISPTLLGKKISPLLHVEKNCPQFIRIALQKDAHDYKNVHRYFQIFMLHTTDERKEHTPD